MIKYIFLLSVLCTFNADGQTTINNFSDKSVCWLGVDFSVAKFIGKDGFRDPFQIKAHYFNEWNVMFIRGDEVTALGKAFKLKDYTFNTDAVTKNNNLISMDGFIQDEPYKVNRSQIQKNFSTYDLTGVGEDVGISFMVETFNNNLNTGIIWVVLSSIDTKQVFFAERIEEKPYGAGVRNYWAGVIKDVFASCKWHIKKWKKEGETSK